MKLTIEQIQQLYGFTKQHYVEWFDLQSELVDHLANAIENQWETFPKRTFDEALQLEFKKFGVFGFMDVVEERQKFLHKKYLKLIWFYYKEFFKLPKIILTVCLIYAVFLFCKFTQDVEMTLFVLFLAIISFAIFELIKLNSENKKREKITGKKWLFETVAQSFNGFPFLFIPGQMINAIHSFSNHNWSEMHSIFGSIVLVLFGLFIYIQIKIIPKKVAKELQKMYSDYQIV